MDFFQLLVSGIANGCVYGLIALGFVMIYKATEAVNFAQGDFMMLGAFVMIGFGNSGYWGLPFGVAIVLTLVVMGALGYLIDRLLLRRVAGESQTAIIILTIALGFVMRFIAGIIWGHSPQSLENPLAGQELRLAGITLGMEDVAVILVTVALTVGLFFFFGRTKLGLAMQAASQNQLAAYYMGIPVKRVQGFIWALSGVVAGIAGILFATKGSVDPTTGLIGIKAFAAAVIGGFGSLPGALLGGLVIGIIEPFASRYMPAGYSQIAPYALLLIVLVFRPSGLFSQLRNKKV
ncbi:MAG: branched-chain amino acid ABC transporter permease [OCS116 cluster bacterium]|uniref:Branched-chain amino acid ABC transporter permease n=1 Tax=OCS116 cluster bacterium TaxID=2030921 RepID=A0A2A4Z5S3_9PROT|nr:branched-chain amino acid ABC transporter permease [OCS116 cluster bacterium]